MKPVQPLLLKEERISVYLFEKSRVARVEDLRRELKVSVATIRRDLEVLEEEGKVRRVHGGAVSMENRLEEAFLMTRPISIQSRNMLSLLRHMN